MRLFWLFYLTILIQIKLYSCFIESAWLAYAAVGTATYYAYRWRCNYVECCELKDPERFYFNLKERLDRQLFGQPILNRVLPQAIHQHINKQKPSNPLIISLHGWTGSGKTYSSEIVAEALFEKGLKSIFVKKITPAAFFPDPTLVNSYKVSTCFCNIVLIFFCCC